MFRAVVQSIGTFVGFIILTLAFFSSEDLFGTIIGVIVILIGFFVSRYVFKLSLRRPASELSRFSIPDLDSLKPAPGSGIIEMSPEELVLQFNSNKWTLKAGKLTIWGDWNSKGLDQPKEIEQLSYDQSKKKLQFDFSDGKLEILEPNVMHLSSAYLKIMQATSIKWSWGSDSILMYKNSNGNVSRKSNVEVDLSDLDIDATQPALIFSNFD